MYFKLFISATPIIEREGMDILSQGSSPALVTMYSNPQFKLEIGSNVKKLKMMGGGGNFPFLLVEN